MVGQIQYMQYAMFFGNGFDYDTVRSSHGRGAGFGLYSIEDRITFLGGSMKIKTAPGKGCCVVLTVPKDISQKTAKPAPSPEGTWSLPLHCTCYDY